MRVSHHVTQLGVELNLLWERTAERSRYSLERRHKRFSCISLCFYLKWELDKIEAFIKKGILVCTITEQKKVWPTWHGFFLQEKDCNIAKKLLKTIELNCCYLQNQSLLYSDLIAVSWNFVHCESFFSSDFEVWLISIDAFKRWKIWPSICGKVIPLLGCFNRRFSFLFAVIIMEKSWSLGLGRYGWRRIRRRIENVPSSSSYFYH